MTPDHPADTASPQAPERPTGKGPVGRLGINPTGSIKGESRINSSDEPQTTGPPSPQPRRRITMSDEPRAPEPLTDVRLEVIRDFVARCLDPKVRTFGEDARSMARFGLDLLAAVESLRGRADRAQAEADRQRRRAEAAEAERDALVEHCTGLTRHGWVSLVKHMGEAGFNRLPGEVTWSLSTSESEAEAIEILFRSALAGSPAGPEGEPHDR